MSPISKLLSDELKKRQKKNASYSLRSFAKYLEMSPAALSQVMSGKRGMSVKKMTYVVEKLGLSPKQQLRVLEVDSSAARKLTKVKDDEFRLISDWYHYAILSLGELKNNKADPRWIAKRLNIDTATANRALARLERMGVIEIKSGRFTQIVDSLATTRDIPSASIRNFHKGILELAHSKIELVPVEKREYSAITMAVNSKKLKKAKELTQKYKEQMLELLEEGNLDSVYQLSIQLFPLAEDK